jgi:hypothetical protein
MDGQLKRGEGGSERRERGVGKGRRKEYGWAKATTTTLTQLK